MSARGPSVRASPGSGGNETFETTFARRVMILRVVVSFRTLGR